MMSSKFFTAILAAYSLSTAIDFFPLETGRIWRFNYKEFAGHSGGGTTKEGSIQWTINSQTVRDPGKGSSNVRIIQKNELKRKKYSYSDKVNDYDSLFDPPRVSIDTLTFVDSANVCIDAATGRILVHDPQKSVPGNYCVMDSSLEVNGNELSCVIPVDTPCGLNPNSEPKTARHLEYHYFFQNQTLGPVKYFFNSHGDVVFAGGVTWSEWIIQSPTSPLVRPTGHGMRHSIKASEKSESVAINGGKIRMNGPRAGGLYVFTSSRGKGAINKRVVLP
jgi:hypothetical protein